MILFSTLLHRFALFRFAGTIGVVDISRFASYGYDQRLEVFGPGGMLQVANDNPNTSIRYTDEGISRLVWGFNPNCHETGRIYLPYNFRIGFCQLNFYQKFPNNFGGEN